MATKDKRREPRHLAWVKITCESKGGRKSRLQGLDLSREGVLVTPPGVLREGSVVTLHIRLGKAAKITVRGEARHISAAGTGVRFVKILKEDRKKLDAYLKETALSA
jgi:hypothetical protein